MDWARAKNIIIFILLAFNVFLLSMIIIFASEKGVSNETIQNTKKILESRGIALECEIPRYYVNMPKLSYGDDVYDKDAVVLKLLGKNALQEQNNGKIIYKSGSKDLTFESNDSFIYTDNNPGTKLKDEKQLKKYLTDCGLVNSTYFLYKKDQKPDGSIYFTYIEKYKGYMVFDNFVKATVSTNGITNIESKFKEIKSLSVNKVNDITAAYQVLLENFDGSKKLTITSIDIGYKNANNQEQNMIQSSEQPPAWRIEIEGLDTPYYFSTADGKEIK